MIMMRWGQLAAALGGVLDRRGTVGQQHAGCAFDESVHGRRARGLEVGDTRGHWHVAHDMNPNPAA